MISLTAVPWILLQNFVNAVTYVKRSPYISSANQPDQIKIYAGKEYLFASRIFKPANPTTSKLPLVIRIHGGGFIVNNPAADDVLARFLADRAQCVVVSMDYSKAPRNPFPAAYEDLIDLSLAAIGDLELGIHPGKVVLCGSSSGGNLALAIAQDSRLRSKLHGVIAFTPAVDLVTPLENKMATRPDPTIPDFLESMYHNIVKFYIAGQEVSLEDVRISPNRFASRQDLPEHMYLCGAEHDLLSREAELMAEKLAQGFEKQKTEKGWQAGPVKWDHFKGQTHGFENFPAKDKELEAMRISEVNSAFQNMADWLKDVFERI